MLIVLGIAAVILTIIDVDSTRCTPAAPCLPDPTSSALAILGLALLAGWWLPSLAAGAAAVFAVLDVLYDDSEVAHYAFTIWALLHLAHLFYLRRARAAQHRLAGQAVLPIPPDWQRPVETGSLPIVHWVKLGGVAIGLAVAAIAGSLYLSDVRSDAALQGGAQTLEATVTAVDPDDILTITLTPERRIEGLPESVELEVMEEYAVGAQVPINVNAADPDWTHLVAEPPDRTDWLLLAVGGLLAGLGATALALHTDIRRRMLAARVPTSGVPVRILRVPGEPEAGIAVVDRDVVCAQTPLSVPRQEERARIAPVAPDETDGSPAEWGYVVGEFRDGGLIGIVTKDVSVAGMAAVTVLPDLPRFDADWSEDDEEIEFERMLARSEPVPVEDPVAPLPLPWHDQPPQWVRLKGLGQVALAAVFVGLFIFDPRETSVFQAIVFGIVAIGFVVDGGDDLFSRARVDEDEVRISTAWRDHVTPLSSVVQVRRSRQVVLVVDVSAEASGEPWGSGEAGERRSRREPQEPDEPDEGIIALEAGEDAAALAQAIDRASTRARARHATQTGGFAQVSVSRWRASAVLLAALIGLIVAMAVRAAIL